MQGRACGSMRQLWRRAHTTCSVRGVEVGMQTEQEMERTNE
jgi:hypothetical protein